MSKEKTMRLSSLVIPSPICHVFMSSSVEAVQPASSSGRVDEWSKQRDGERKGGDSQAQLLGQDFP